MKLFVTGGRDYGDPHGAWCVLDRVYSMLAFKLLVHGDARGLDTIAHKWALDHGVQPVCCPANWDVFKKAAGPIRNRVMIEIRKPHDVLLAFPGGPGTANMVHQWGTDASYPLLRSTDFEKK